MVQIVGKDNSAVKRCTCKNCASILEYTESEVYKIELNQDKFDVFLICPGCNKRVVVG